MHAREIEGQAVRIPDPVAGEVGVVTRYGKSRAVLMHPDDWERLRAAEALLEAASALAPLESTTVAEHAHRAAETPGVPQTDPAALDALFG